MFSRKEILLNGSWQFDDTFNRIDMFLSVPKMFHFSRYLPNPGNEEVEEAIAEYEACRDR